MKGYTGFLKRRLKEMTQQRNYAFMACVLLWVTLVVCAFWILHTEKQIEELEHLVVKKEFEKQEVMLLLEDTLEILEELEKMTIRPMTENINTKHNEESKSAPHQAQVSRGSFKSYMDYRTITNKNSKQYEIQSVAWTDEEGFRRLGEDYIIALGTHYTKEAGARFEIELCSGKVFTAIAGDIKANEHTVEGKVAMDGSVVEFVVDSSKISEKSKRMGDMSYSGFEGEVLEIRRIE